VRSLEGMLKVGKFLVWVLAVVIFLDNIGFKVSTLLAGLGIGGVAVAIAAQALLEDFLVIFHCIRQAVQVRGFHCHRRYHWHG